MGRLEPIRAVTGQEVKPGNQITSTPTANVHVSRLKSRVPRRKSVSNPKNSGCEVKAPTTVPPCNRPTYNSKSPKWFYFLFIEPCFSSATAPKAKYTNTVLPDSTLKRCKAPNLFELQPLIRESTGAPCDPGPRGPLMCRRHQTATCGVWRKGACITEIAYI